MIPRKTSRIKTRFGYGLIGGTTEASDRDSVCIGKNGDFVFRKHLWKGQKCRRCGVGRK